MPSISTERLSGLIAGAFLIRTSESFLSTVNVFFFMPVDMGSKMAGGGPALLWTLITGFLGYAYLLPDRKKWLHVVALIACALSICGLLSTALVPFFMSSPASLDSMRYSMFFTTLIKIAISLALLACVIVVMKRSAPTALPSA